MSELKRPARRQAISVGPLGLPEAIALGVSLVLLIAAFLSYFLVLQPSYERQKKLDLERATAQKQLEEIRQRRTDGQTTQQSVEQIATSVANFERVYLSRRETGRLALYTLLNDLMRRNKVRNTSGPAYAPLEPLKDEDQARRSNQTANQAGGKGNDQWATIYPGINVNVTVEGKYQDLRRFIRDLEATGQFLVINNVELEGTRDQKKEEEEKAAAGNLPPGAPFPGRPVSPAQPLPAPNAQEAEEIRRGERVSLRLELAAYFQREGLNALAATP